MSDAGETKLIDELAEKLACAKDDAIIRGIVEAVREGRIAVQVAPRDVTYDWGAGEVTANIRGGVRVVFPEIERLTADRDWATKTLRWIRGYLSVHSDSAHNMVIDNVLDAIDVALGEPVRSDTRAWVEGEVNALGDEE